jgi:predicted lipoprotein
MKPALNRRASMSVAALVSAALAAYLLASSPACDDSTSIGTPPYRDKETLVSSAGSFTRNDLLAAIGLCALDGYRTSAQKMALVAAAARDHESEQTPPSLAAARASFADAMVDYERIELMQFGPFAKKVATGGDGIRDLVYAWPNVDRCLIDETLVAKGYDEADFKSKAAAGARGLATLEYLLFFDAPTNACADAAAINTGGAWQALDGGELARRRAAYARVIADDVASRLAELVEKWEPSGGNFLAELAGAGTDSRYFTSQNLALNAVMDALFYVGIELKDQKIGRPLGVAGTCPGDCGDEVEAPYSKLGRAHVAANLAGFRAMFFGCGERISVLGFDDLFAGVGAARVADDVGAALSDAEAALAQIPEGKLEEELRAKSATATALHEALRALAELLKTEVVTVLNLELPGSVEGDND